MNASEKRYQRPDVPRDDRPIRVGSLLFTMVEPHKGHEVAYNRWYERDHFYAGCMVGKWQFAGSRYVATRDCKAKRYPSPSTITPDASVGSYLAVYWVLDEHHDEWNEWGVEQVNWLHANDRMFLERDHIHTALYQYAGEATRRGATRPSSSRSTAAYRGVAVLIGEMADGVDGGQVQRLARRTSRALADVALVGTPLPLRDDRPGDVPDTQAANRVLVIGVPRRRSARDVGHEAGSGSATRSRAPASASIVFASPFLATDPGHRHLHRPALVARVREPAARRAA